MEPIAKPMPYSMLYSPTNSSDLEIQDQGWTTAKANNFNPFSKGSRKIAKLEMESREFNLNNTKDTSDFKGFMKE